ncbi:hypothetical protein ACFLS9_02885 [Bacteroidota bacterium]
MNRVLPLVLMTFVTANILFAQERDFLRRREMAQNKLEELEKIKIIEILDMDEETTLRFFSRRETHLEQQKKLIEERNDEIEQLEDKIRAEEFEEEFYKEKIEIILDFEQKAFAARKEFLTSLSDILTTEQIAKLIVFEIKFKREVREAFFRRHRPRN